MADQQGDPPIPRLLTAGLMGLALGIALLRGSKSADSETLERPLPEPSLSQVASIPEAPKLLMEHKLQVRRLVYDKVLIGLLLVLAGVGASLLVESYKATAAQSHFFLDKRLLAATEIRRSLTEVVTPLYVITQAACTGSAERDEDSTSVKAALEKFASILNSSSLLVDETYMANAERAMSIFYGVAAQECYTSCDVRIFISHVSQFVTDETRQQVMPGGDSTVIAARGTSFRPLAWTKRQLQAEGNRAFMKQNYDAWRTRQNEPATLGAVCRKRS